MFEIGEIIIAIENAPYHHRWGYAYQKGDQFTVIKHFSPGEVIIDHPKWGEMLIENINFFISLSELRNQKISSLRI